MAVAALLFLFRPILGDASQVHRLRATEVNLKRIYLATLDYVNALGAMPTDEMNRLSVTPLMRTGLLRNYNVLKYGADPRDNNESYSESENDFAACPGLTSDDLKVAQFDPLTFTNRGILLALLPSAAEHSKGYANEIVVIALVADGMPRTVHCNPHLYEHWLAEFKAGRATTLNDLLQCRVDGDPEWIDRSPK